MAVRNLAGVFRKISLEFLQGFIGGEDNDSLVRVLGDDMQAHPPKLVFVNIGSAVYLEAKNQSRTYSAGPSYLSVFGKDLFRLLKEMPTVLLPTIPCGKATASMKPPW